MEGVLLLGKALPRPSAEASLVCLKLEEIWMTLWHARTRSADNHKNWRDSMRTANMIACSFFAAILAAPMAFGQTPAPAPAPTLRGTPPEPYKYLTKEEVARLAFRPGPVNSAV